MITNDNTKAPIYSEPFRFEARIYIRKEGKIIMAKKRVKSIHQSSTDLNKISATKKDITVHMYDLPGTPYDGNFKLYIADPDPSLPADSQYYFAYVGIANHMTVDYAFGMAVLPNITKKPRNYDEVEQFVLENLLSRKYMREKPLMNDLANHLYTRQYFNSDEFYQHLDSLMENSTGRKLLISKDENMLEYEPFGEVVGVDPGTVDEEGIVYIHPYQGDDIAAPFSQFADFLERHAIIFAAEPDEDGVNTDLLN